MTGAHAPSTPAGGVKGGGFALAFIFLTVLLNMIGFGIIMPVMPGLLMAVADAPLSDAARWGGYLSLVYAVAQFVMMPIIGGLSDRFGRRPVMLASLAAYSFDFLIMAVAPSITVLLIARLFSGAFAATFSTANAYIADISPPEKRAANFGLMGAAFGLGFIIGPGIGGILGEAFGPRAPFFAVAAIGALNFVFGFFAMPETLAPQNRRRFEWRRANAFGNFRQFAKYPVMLPIAATIFLLQLANWTFPSVWSYFASEKFAWGADEIGWSLMFVGFMAALVQAGVVRLVVPAIGERASALVGMAIATATYFGFAIAPDERTIYALIAISAFAALATPALQGIMSRTIPADAQGELQGAIGAVMSVSMVLGPPVMTQVFAAFSEPTAPIGFFGLPIAPEGVGVYFPGAPFILAGILSGLAVFPALAAFGRIARPRTPATTPAAE
ncbi:MAG: TCR/Tet family MFS transporter [Pseudomonadota bacterium]